MVTGHTGSKDFAPLKTTNGGISSIELCDESWYRMPDFPVVRSGRHRAPVRDFWELLDARVP
jgi:hypothetical protein